MSIETLKQEFNVTTRYIHFPLHPDTPDEGISIQKLFANRDAADLKAAGDHIRGLMREAGLAYGDRTMTYNSRLAQELGAWADAETDHGDALHNKLFEAYFVRNDNIGDASVLLALVTELGLPVERASEVLTNRLYSPEINAQWQRSWDNGITGVPTFVSHDLMVVGHQTSEVLARFVRHLQTLPYTVVINTQ